MPYPKLYRDLFQDGGASNKLNEEIMPATVVKATEQTLSDSEKSQALVNIDAQSASELKTALEELIVEFGGTVPEG